MGAQFVSCSKYGGTIDGTLLRFAGEYYTDAESDLYEVEMRGRDGN